MCENFATPRNAAPTRRARDNTPRSTPISVIQKSSSRRLSAAFKSPLREPNEKQSQTVSVDEERKLKQEVATLREEEARLDTDIKLLLSDGYKVEELNDHIQMLHDYNEIKDIGQMILGRIATRQGITTKDLYEQYDLHLDD